MISAEFTEACKKALSAIGDASDGHNARLCAGWSFLIHGAGMPPDILEKAFQPFFTTKGAGVGTGFGLSMVRDFATQSSWTAQIRSEIGKGTTITIYLPRATTIDSPL
jgi:signal transduction histidine kinase